MFGIFQLNEDVDRRDQILFDEDFDPQKYGGGIRRFKGLDAYWLDVLMDLKFINPDDSNNDSPTARDFLRFLEAHPQFTAHGYAVSLERFDYRITIEGVEAYDEDISDEELEQFHDAFSDADEFESYPMSCRCWYD